MAGTIARNIAVLMGGASLAMALAGQAFAQGTNTTERQDRVTLLQRLVVGAGVEKVAIDTPQAVTVVEQEDIDIIQPQTIGEVIRTIPGVNVTGSDRLLGQSFNIRGIGAPDTSGDQGRIVLNVDGVQKFYEQYRLGSFFSDPELYNRVEVLRGPASSTLYGSGALGGVINFTTKDASDFIADGDRGAVRLKTSYDSNGNGMLYSGTLAHRMSENAEFLLSGNYRLADNFESGNETEIVGTEFRAWSGLAKGTFGVGEEGTLRLSYQRFDSDLDDQYFSQVGGPGFAATVDRHVIDQTAIVAYENPFLDNDMLDVKVSASYSRTDNEQRDASLRAACTNTSSAILCDSDYAYETWQLGAQNTMEWSGDRWQNFLTVGSQSTFQTRVASTYFNNGEPFPVGFHPEGTDFKTGIFAQNEFVWDDRLTLIPGVRLDWHRLSPDGDVIDPSTGQTAADSSDTAFSPKIAAHYKLNDTLAVFGSLAHTERFPSIDETFSTAASSTTFLPSIGLRKERSNNVEAGFAVSGYDLVATGDAAQIKVTGFYNKVRDLIALNPSLVGPPPGPPSPPVFNNLPGYVNIDRATLYGFEIEAAYDWDYIYANAAYSHVIGRNDATGAYLQTIAPHEVALTIGGKLPQHDLRFGWTARFVAAPQDDARNSDGPLPAPNASSSRYATAFDVHNVFVSWTPQEGRFAGWDVQAGVDNVFNRQYKEFLGNDAAKGRTFKVSLAKQFGY
jgi:hemoglobin/transferrin/lactoferrin receptor protein